MGNSNANEDRAPVVVKALSWLNIVVDSTAVAVASRNLNTPRRKRRKKLRLQDPIISSWVITFKSDWNQLGIRSG
jgi:hypothetical protein